MCSVTVIIDLRRLQTINRKVDDRCGLGGIIRCGVKILVLIKINYMYGCHLFVQMAPVDLKVKTISSSNGLCCIYGRAALISCVSSYASFSSCGHCCCH